MFEIIKTNCEYGQTDDKPEFILRIFSLDT